MLVLGPVSEGGCGVNHIGGTHELLHILGLAHVQNRPDRWDQIAHQMTNCTMSDRCNYIDVRTDLLTGWGEWKVGQITGAADWFELRWHYLKRFFHIKSCHYKKNLFTVSSRIPYDCSSYIHYYQLQGAFWKKSIEKQESWKF